jgi:opacity protein-like surface antigen
MIKLLATAALSLSALLSAVPAQAAICTYCKSNGTEANGVKLNGYVWNGVKLNGYVWNGLALNGYVWNGTESTGLHRPTVFAVTLPEGAAQ